MKKIIILPIFLALIQSALADAGDEACGMGSMMYGNFGYGPMIFGWVFSLLVLVALILLITWLMKQIQKK
jgi:uncharacterized membrane protein